MQQAMNLMLRIMITWAYILSFIKRNVNEVIPLLYATRGKSCKYGFNKLSIKSMTIHMEILINLINSIYAIVKFLRRCRMILTVHYKK